MINSKCMINCNYIIFITIIIFGGKIRTVKNSPAMRETEFDPWLGKIPWRRERLPTSVLCPGECHGLYSPWGCKDLNTTEQLSLHSLDLSKLLDLYKGKDHQRSYIYCFKISGLFRNPKGSKTLRL